MNYIIYSYNLDGTIYPPVIVPTFDDVFIYVFSQSWLHGKVTSYTNNWFAAGSMVYQFECLLPVSIGKEKVYVGQN